jgi:hypothetical protein
MEFPEKITVTLTREVAGSIVALVDGALKNGGIKQFDSCLAILQSINEGVKDANTLQSDAGREPCSTGNIEQGIVNLSSDVGH